MDGITHMFKRMHKDIPVNVFVKPPALPADEMSQSAKKGYKHEQNNLSA